MSSLTVGGRITFSLIQENENPTSFDTDHVQASSHSEAVVIDENEINGDDTTLNLFPINSAVCTPPVMRIPTPPPLRCSRPCFLGVNDGVDGTLSLGIPGSRSTSVTKKKWREGDDHNHVDLSAGAVYNPTPLRWFGPDCNGTDHDLVDSTALFPKPSIEGGDQRVPKRRKKACDDENQRPLIPIEEIPGLFQTLKSRGGSGPVFLFQKKLEDSDGIHGLLVTRAERMMEFLREEEEAVNGVIKILGIDGGGKVYEDMGLTKWAMLKLIVINSDWRRMMAQNNAEAGDVVEIWGYRENEKPCLVFNFRRDRVGVGGGEFSAAATSSSNNI